MYSDQPFEINHFTNYQLLEPNSTEDLFEGVNELDNVDLDHVFKCEAAESYLSQVEINESTLFD